MTGFRRTVSGRDTAIVAAALLLPIPLFARAGLSLPFSGGLEKSLGSLITLDSEDGTTGTQPSGRASAESDDGRQAGQGSLRMSPGLNPLTVFRTQVPTLSSSQSDEGTSQTAGVDQGSGDAPAGSEPEGADDAGGAGSPGGSGEEPATDSSGGGTEGSAPAPAPRQGAAGSPLSVNARGEGSTATVSAGEGGLDVNVGVNDSARSGDGSDAGVSVTQPDGSSTGTETTVPGVEQLLP